MAKLKKKKRRESAINKGKSISHGDNLITQLLMSLLNHSLLRIEQHITLTPSHHLLFNLIDPRVVASIPQPLKPQVSHVVTRRQHPRVSHDRKDLKLRTIMLAFSIERKHPVPEPLSDDGGREVRRHVQTEGILQVAVDFPRGFAGERVLETLHVQAEERRESSYGHLLR